MSPLIPAEHLSAKERAAEISIILANAIARHHSQNPLGFSAWKSVHENPSQK